MLTNLNVIKYKTVNEIILILILILNSNSVEVYKKQWLKDINVEEKNYQKIVENEEQVITK